MGNRCNPDHLHIPSGGEKKTLLSAVCIDLWLKRVDRRPALRLPRWTVPCPSNCASSFAASVRAKLPQRRVVWGLKLLGLLGKFACTTLIQCGWEVAKAKDGWGFAGMHYLCMYIIFIECVTNVSHLFCQVMTSHHPCFTAQCQP